MREIKFRAWNRLLKRMFAVYCIDWKHGLIFCQGEDGNTHTFGFIDMDLREYTGLKDKNGKEIYEGDILFVECECDAEYGCSHWPASYQVKWNQETASFELYEMSGKYSGMEFEDDYVCEYEVIGNVYENADLLTQV